MSNQDIPEEDFFGPEPANTIPKYEGIIRSPDDSSNVNAEPENSIQPDSPEFLQVEENQTKGTDDYLE